MDLNDRALRQTIVGMGGKANGMPRETGFDIAVASEFMAILCLASDLEDFKARVNRIVVGYTYADKPVTVADLKVAGALTALFKDAIKPNLVQTLEGTPAFVHGGPFANIAHGCNSIMASKFALKLGDVLVTEAGFGADLGAEKFIDIKCRFSGFQPDAVVIVATVRALKMHGGVAKADLGKENVDALEKGLANLQKHIENVQSFGLPAVVAVNAFPTDTKAELDRLVAICTGIGADVSVSEVWARGGEGGVDLARKVEAAFAKKGDFRFLYDVNLPIKEKINAIATRIYGADGVDFTAAASKTIDQLTAMGLDKTPICMAKTQYSLSDDAAKLGRPSGFRITVREVRASVGAGFLVAIAGEIMTMPGLPKKPAAEVIDIDNSGVIGGLF